MILAMEAIFNRICGYIDYIIWYSIICTTDVVCMNQRCASEAFIKQMKWAPIGSSSLGQDPRYQSSLDCIFPDDLFNTDLINEDETYGERVYLEASI
jgi:hypothetical protein